MATKSFLSSTYSFFRKSVQDDICKHNSDYSRVMLYISKKSWIEFPLKQGIILYKKKDISVIQNEVNTSFGQELFSKHTGKNIYKKLYFFRLENSSCSKDI